MHRAGVIVVVVVVRHFTYRKVAVEAAGCILIPSFNTCEPTSFGS